MFISDGYALFFKITFLIIAFLTVLISMGYTQREGIEFGEYYALILFATLGMMLMAGGNSFDHHLPRIGDDVDLHLYPGWNDA